MKWLNVLSLRIRQVSGAIILASATVGGLGQVGTSDHKEKDLTLVSQFKQTDQLFSKYDTTVTPGCALAVMRDGHILYKRGYGMADLDHNIPITPQTVFHVASMSKQFTATAVLLLSMEGKLSLDDDVHKYLTQLPNFGAKITVNDLLHHTSGIRDQWQLLNLAGWRQNLDLITDQDVLNLLYKQKELNFSPGQRFLYNNSGFTLLAQIVNKLSGESLRQFTSTRIFELLGMLDTHFRDDHAEIVKRDAYGYAPAEGLNTFKIFITNFDTVGPTGLLTTVEDLARWDENFYDQRVGGAELNRLQLTPGKLSNGNDVKAGDSVYASGLTIGSYRGLRTVDHPGSDAGYRADLLRFPDKHFSVACLCNRSDAQPQKLVYEVADIYLTGDFTQPVPAISNGNTKQISFSQEQLNQYKGSYWDDESGHALVISANDAQLAMVLPNGNKRKLAPVDDRTFKLADSADTLVFGPLKDGVSLGVAVHHELEPIVIYRRTEPVHLTQEQLATYAGTYVSDEVDTKMQFVVSGSSLVLHRAKRAPQVFKPTILDSFQDDIGAADIHFMRGANGKVQSFVLDMGRITNMQFHRVE